MAYPCDALIPSPDAVLHRAVSVAAPAPVVFRWLCQLREAPYSYDWLDNGGRRSPPRWKPGLEQLQAGQDVMRIFDLESFARDDHITIRIKPGTRGFRLFGDVAGTYRVLPRSPSSCRLLAKLVVAFPLGRWGAIVRRVLPPGDLVMMRRQLLNLKALAERSAATEVRPVG
jgi:hypothetical protein